MSKISPCYVTLYSVTREFGGYEEGGWYFDWYEPIRSVRCRNMDHAYKMRDRLQAAQPKPRYPRYSVLGGADEIWRVERERGEHETLSAPYYE